ncbi:unnamed protein product [Rhizoctonia solani]|uniref:Transposase family Tnp2 protein n=1 Tax=Rhizoctonia solani TaxID=456999 RepID=A0A8H3AHR6_9AGAM|nr:unnamed protein product [Rhizoctonia solani]
MSGSNSLGTARERARKNKKGLGFYTEPRLCDCKKCYGVERGLRGPATIETHIRRYGRHPMAQARPVNTSMNDPGTSTSTYLGDTYPDDNFPTDNFPTDMFPDDNLPDYSHSGSHACSRAHSKSPAVSHLDSPGSSRSRPLGAETCLSADRDSDSDDPDRSPGDFVPIITDSARDAWDFGPGLAEFRAASPPPLRLRGGLNDSEEEGDRDEYEPEEDEEGEPEGPEGPDDGAEVEDEDGPPIHINPEGEPGPPEEPGDDGDAQDMPALNEHPILRNIYLRTWVQYAFAGVTQDSIQAILESHKSSLLAVLDTAAGAFPEDFPNQVRKMPTTLRSLERRLGLDFTDLITIYPVCPDPDCGKRYTMEQMEALLDPQCTRRVDGERCEGLVYTETTLATGKQKRTPLKSFPSTSLPDALGRLLSRPGIADLMQGWRREGDEPVHENVPPPLGPDEWFEQMGPGDKFGDMTQSWVWRTLESWVWRTLEVGLRRGWNEVLQEYVDEPVGEAPLSLVRMQYGISLSLNTDGFQKHRGKYAAGGSYSVTGAYIIINNLPFYLRYLIENMILVVVMPGPKEPKGYALTQMLEPLVNDLIALSNGVELPVYNSRTHRIERHWVYAQLSALLMDWIARIKCIGHVGVTSEHNHCTYCKIRQCRLGEAQGYQSEGYELRDPHEHLQAKHEWQRLPAQREAIRERTGTIFTIFDRIPGFYSFDMCPPDSMHLFDLGITPAIMKFVYQLGMLRKRYRRQPFEETPEARFDAFMERCYFPHFCGCLPTEASCFFIFFIF